MDDESVTTKSLIELPMLDFGNVRLTNGSSLVEVASPPAQTETSFESNLHRTSRIICRGKSELLKKSNALTRSKLINSDLQPILEARNVAMESTWKKPLEATLKMEFD